MGFSNGVHLRKAQQGAILFVSLILLIVLTLLAFTTLRTATIQERMTGNARDRVIALQAAEAALRAAEKYLTATVTLPSGTMTTTPTCSKGIYKLSGGVPYFVASTHSFAGTNTLWDGSSSDFWNEYPWETTNCSYSGVSDYVTFVAAADYGKPGKPKQSPRYVIEELPANGTGLPSYRVTAKGYGANSNAVVIIQATYTSN